MTSGGRSTLTPCQNVELEFITHAATVLHNNTFSGAVAITSFSPMLRTIVSCAHVFTPVGSYIHPKLTVMKKLSFVFNVVRAINRDEN